MPLFLKNVHRGKHDRSHIVYAEVVNENGTLEMGASLDDILVAAKDRGWKLTVSAGALQEVVDCVYTAAGMELIK